MRTIALRVMKAAAAIAARRRVLGFISLRCLAQNVRPAAV
jgi:hypothetical protein